MRLFQTICLLSTSASVALLANAQSAPTSTQSTLDEQTENALRDYQWREAAERDELIWELQDENERIKRDLAAVRERVKSARSDADPAREREQCTALEQNIQANENRIGQLQRSEVVVRPQLSFHKLKLGDIGAIGSHRVKAPYRSYIQRIVDGKTLVMVVVCSPPIRGYGRLLVVRDTPTAGLSAGSGFATPPEGVFRVVTVLRGADYAREFNEHPPIRKDDVFVLEPVDIDALQHQLRTAARSGDERSEAETRRER